MAKLGSSLAIRIRVTDLPLPKSFNAVRGELQANADCPRWQEEKLKGKWFFEQASISLQAVPYSELVAWEDIVKELLTRNDFTQKKRDFFFHVNGISAVQSGAVLAPVDGEFRLRPSTEYELDIYHFYPKSDLPAAKSISLASSSDRLSLFSLQRAWIDSPYDLKSWRFKCEGDIREKFIDTRG